MHPIAPFLADLFAWQDAFRRLSPFEDWLVNLDIASDDIRAISNQHGTKARALYDLFLAQTGSKMSLTRFGTEMKRMADLGRGPFAPKDSRHDSGVHYPHRAQP